MGAGVGVAAGEPEGGRASRPGHAPGPGSPCTGLCTDRGHHSREATGQGPGRVEQDADVRF